ncbi:MAG: hypothetical protein WBB24_12770 [Maribacter sp.]
MRKLSLTLVAAMLLAAGSLKANDNTNVGPVKSLSSQIGVLLSGNNFNVDEVGLTAQVRFTLNSDGEIVVLSVDTKEGQLESFVKNKLNYKKVEMEKVEEGKIYTIPVTIKA